MNYQMLFQMYTADGESHEKGRNKCNRCVIRVKRLFMRIVTRMEGAMKKLLSFWQIIAFCLILSNLRGEK